MAAAESDIADIERLEDRRYAAMLDADTTALAPLLHDDLVYMHSTGGRAPPCRLTETRPCYTPRRHGHLTCLP